MLCLVTNHVVEKVASLFKETALSVYHAIGLSIWHKVLYLNEACHKSVTQSLVAHVECMENRQMRTILKYIVQRYVLNLPRPGFSIGYPFVVTFFKAVGKRMDWMNPILPSSINHHAHEIEYQTVERAGNVKSCFLSESLFDMYIYRKAGISSHFHQKAQFTCEQIEEVRNAIITGMICSGFCLLAKFVILCHKI